VEACHVLPVNALVVHRQSLHQSHRKWAVRWQFPFSFIHHVFKKGSDIFCLSSTDKLRLFLILFEPIFGQSFSDRLVAHENFSNNCILTYTIFVIRHQKNVYVTADVTAMSVNITFSKEENISIKYVSVEGISMSMCEGKGVSFQAFTVIIGFFRAIHSFPNKMTAVVCKNMLTQT